MSNTKQRVVDHSDRALNLRDTPHMPIDKYVFCPDHIPATPSYLSTNGSSNVHSGLWMPRQQPISETVEADPSESFTVKTTWDGHISFVFKGHTWTKDYGTGWFHVHEYNRSFNYVHQGTCETCKSELPKGIEIQGALQGLGGSGWEPETDYKSYDSNQTNILQGTR